MKKEGTHGLITIPTDMNQIFDINVSIDENLMKAPFFNGLLPKIPTIEPSQFHDFLGYKIANRLGVPACSLTSNSKNIKLLSQLGFSVLTHKTIRSTPHQAHPAPNAVYIQYTTPLTLADIHTPVIRTHTKPTSMKNLAIANSIGIASTTLNTSLQDINDARMILQPGQILIASIYGEKNEKRSILDDWAHLARHVVQAGAHIVEANVSCPNIGHSTPLYLNPTAIAELVKQLVNTINPIPLVIKVGTFPDKQLMEQVMIAAARAGAQGICGINGFSMHVVDEHNNPVFGESRKTCGVSGAPIFNLALDWIKNAYAINKKHNLGLTIMGTGGITLSEQFDTFLYAGASVAMSATGTMWDPYLAARYLHEKYYAHSSQTFNYTTDRNYHEHNSQ